MCLICPLVAWFSMKSLKGRVSSARTIHLSSLQKLQHVGHLLDREIHPVTGTLWLRLLRCKTPEMVHKEIWTHLLAYNLLRTVMAIAASENDIAPREVSLKGAKQAVTAFAPKIEAARPENRAALIDAMLTTIVYHRVGNRPGRWEPRARNSSICSAVLRRRSGTRTTLRPPMLKRKPFHAENLVTLSKQRYRPVQDDAVYRISYPSFPSHRSGSDCIHECENRKHR